MTKLNMIFADDQYTENKTKMRFLVLLKLIGFFSVVTERGTECHWHST